MSLEHLPNRDAILDIFDADRVAPLGMAMLWAHETSQEELTELWTALYDHAKRYPSSEIGRAVLIVLDGHIESKRRDAA